MPGGFKEKPIDRMAELNKPGKDDVREIPLGLVHAHLCGSFKDFGFCYERGGPYWRVLTRERTGLTWHFYRSHLCN